MQWWHLVLPQCVQVVKAQMLTEIEEVITYRNCGDSPSRRETIKGMWDRRIQGCTHSGKVWQLLVQLRSLVLQPQDMVETQLEYARICLNEGWEQQSRDVLMSLLIDSDSLIVDAGQEPELSNLREPAVGLALLEHRWQVVRAAVG